MPAHGAFHTPPPPVFYPFMSNPGKYTLHLAPFVSEGRYTRSGWATFEQEMDNVFRNYKLIG